MSLVPLIMWRGGEEAHTVVDPCVKSGGGWNFLHGDHSSEAVSRFLSLFSRVK